MPKKPVELVCRDCGHSRRQHSIIGCLDNGKCKYGCMNKFTDKEKFS